MNATRTPIKWMDVDPNRGTVEILDINGQDIDGTISGQFRGLTLINHHDGEKWVAIVVDLDTWEAVAPGETIGDRVAIDHGPDGILWGTVR